MGGDTRAWYGPGWASCVRFSVYAFSLLIVMCTFPAVSSRRCTFMHMYLQIPARAEKQAIGELEVAGRSTGQ